MIAQTERAQARTWPGRVIAAFCAGLSLFLAGGYVTAQARQSIFEYVEVWYNRQRRHSALGYRLRQPRNIRAEIFRKESGVN